MDCKYLNKHLPWEGEVKGEISQTPFTSWQAVMLAAMSFRTDDYHECDTSINGLLTDCGFKVPSFELQKLAVDSIESLMCRNVKEDMVKVAQRQDGQSIRELKFAKPLRVMLAAKPFDSSNKDRLFTCFTASEFSRLTQAKGRGQIEILFIVYLYLKSKMSRVTYSITDENGVNQNVHGLGAWIRRARICEELAISKDSLMTYIDYLVNANMIGYKPGSVGRDSVFTIGNHPNLINVTSIKQSIYQEKKYGHPSGKYKDAIPQDILKRIWCR